MIVGGSGKRGRGMNRITLQNPKAVIECMNCGANLAHISKQEDRLYVCPVCGNDITELI